MSRPMSGRGGPADFGAQQRAARADREQIRRLVQATPKPPKPPPATGGGILGISRAEVFTWNYRTTSMWPATYGITDLHGASVGISDSGDGGVTVTEAGYYLARTQVSVGWSTDPGYARLEVSSGPSWYTADQSLPAIPAGTPAYESEAGVPYGPLWLDAGGTIYPEVLWRVSSTVTDSFGFVELTRFA